MPFPDPIRFFVVDRTQHKDIKQILMMMTTGGMHLLYGPRQSSKTTTILQCKNQLQKLGQFEVI